MIGLTPECITCPLLLWNRSLTPSQATRQPDHLDDFFFLADWCRSTIFPERDHSDTQAIYPTLSATISLRFFHRNHDVKRQAEFIAACTPHEAHRQCCPIASPSAPSHSFVGSQAVLP